MASWDACCSFVGTLYYHSDDFVLVLLLSYVKIVAYPF